MKKIIYSLVLLICHQTLFAQTGVGIGTNNPIALLHVDTGVVLFSGYVDATTAPDNALVSGKGTRFLWYPKKYALRAGATYSTEWDKDSIGIGSVAFGYGSKAKGRNSFALGEASEAIGDGSFAFGNQADAHGIGAINIGANGYAGHYAVAMGSETYAFGHYSTALGHQTLANAAGGTAVGMFNDYADKPSPTVMTATDRIFQIGNGTNYGYRSNALTILRNGNTGIGDLTPSAKLQVTANGSPIAPQLLLQETENEYARLSFKNTNSSNVWTMAALPNTTNATAQLNIFWQGYGDVLKIFGNGNATLAGTLTQNSDARLKTNIVALTNPVQSLQKLSGYRYQWKDKVRDNAVQIGLIAQEVQSVFPELVKEDEKGTLSVNYSGLVPVLLEGMKEQQKKIDALEKRVQWLMEKISK